MRRRRDLVRHMACIRERHVRDGQPPAYYQAIAQKYYHHSPDVPERVRAALSRCMLTTTASRAVVCCIAAGLFATEQARRALVAQIDALGGAVRHARALRFRALRVFRLRGTTMTTTLVRRRCRCFLQ